MFIPNKETSGHRPTELPLPKRCRRDEERPSGTPDGRTSPWASQSHVSYGTRPLQRLCKPFCKQVSKLFLGFNPPDLVYGALLCGIVWIEHMMQRRGRDSMSPVDVTQCGILTRLDDLQAGLIVFKQCQCDLSAQQLIPYVHGRNPFLSHSSVGRNEFSLRSAV